MNDLHVARLKARVRLSVDEDRARARADAALRAVIDEALAHALERCGVGPHEEICVRRVYAPVTLDLRQSDPALVAALGIAMGEALGDAIARGVGVVRYGSRAHALVDLLCGVAAGDLARVWAWRKLGLWQESEDVSGSRAAEEALRALVSMPQAIVPVLCETARLGALAPFARRVRARQWIVVVRAAIEAVGASSSVVSYASEPAAAAVGPDVHRDAERIARASRIAPHISGEAVLGVRALLAVLEEEPAALRRNAAAARALLATVATLLERPSHAVSDEPRDGARARSARNVEHVDPARADALVALSSAARRALPSQSPSAAEDDDAVDERPIPDVRRRGHTRYGGLLLLLHIVDDLALAGALVDDPSLAGRPLRWSLHALALALVPTAPDDPAILAFAGLPPDAEPPSKGEESATDEERAALERIATRICDCLRERLDRADEPAPRVLSSICLRQSEIAFDPGWIEVRMSLDDVSTPVRRAGLDLDPGWLPWLGAVVRFTYV